MNKCILITGCSSGIGRATAFHFQNKGGYIAATMRSPERETELNQLDNVMVLALDVTCQDFIASAFDKTLSQFGKIDVLVNNAGTGKFILFEEADEPIIRETFETNILGMMWVTKAILPDFRRNKQGTIINVTSTMPHVGLPLATLYCASKMAVEGFSNALYFELKPMGIRVRLVQPGSTRTNASMQHETPGKPQIQDYSSLCNQVAQFMKHRYESEMITMPAKVAEVIYEAAISKSSRFRFVSVRDAKLANLMEKLFPEHTLKSFAARLMGLN